jgi:hypothetical protein
MGMLSNRTRVWIAMGAGAVAAFALGSFARSRDCVAPLRSLRLVYERVEVNPDAQVRILRFQEPAERIRSRLDAMSTTDTFLAIGNRHESLPFRLRTGETGRLLEDEKGCVLEIERPHNWFVRMWGGVRRQLRI